MACPDIDRIKPEARLGVPQRCGHLISCSGGLLVCGDVLVLDRAVVVEGGASPAVVANAIQANTARRAWSALSKRPPSSRLRVAKKLSATALS
jgi:hypothetical protein